MALSSPMRLTSSASFSPSIRINLRLKIHQAQAKNFCRVLDIRVTQIVKAHPAQAVVLQKLRKRVGQVVHPHPLPQLVHKHKAIILVIVTVAADLLIEFLRLFHPQKVFPEAADQRQCTQTGLGLGRLLFNFRLLAIKSNGRNGSYDRNRSTLKVDGVPLQSQHFTPTESIKSGHQHRQLQLGTPKGFKHLLHFLCRKENRLKAVFLWAYPPCPPHFAPAYRF